MESINEDMKKVKFIVEDHERKEHEMSAYLTSLAGERPSEGKFIVGKFEQFDKKFVEVAEAILSLQVADTMNATSEQAEMEEVKTKVKTLSNAYATMTENGSVTSFQALQNRITAVEAVV